MSERWVLDASPLIALGSIGRLELLALLADDVVVPETVAGEVRRVADEASRAFAQEHLRTVAVEADDRVSRAGLGPGETAVLSFASRRDYVAVIDDLAARPCAMALGTPARGTLGVVLLAKQQGIIPSAGDLVARLRDAGLYLSPGLIAQALAIVGEREDD